MKRFNWLLIGSGVLCLVFVLFAGCGVPKSEYEALQVDKANLETELEAVQLDLANLQADYDALQADYEAVNEELAEIKEVYPPRDFESRQELIDWRSSASIFDTINPLDDCRSLQQAALQDGYIVSISTGLEPGGVYGCRAIAGDSIYQILPWELGAAWIDYVY